ncbi:MAG: hypothetical protein IJP42_09285 [Selenomonadaceae bacterium]|nr:hypothetical protein [Selenomonadaceae bacterium]
MKKFLAMAVLVFAVIIGQATQVEAEEVYGATETRGGKITDHYIVTESFQLLGEGRGEFKVTLHAIGRNFYEDEYWDVAFIRKNGDMHVVFLPSSYSQNIDGDEFYETLYLTIRATCR